MSEKNITVDISPILKMLEALICEGPALTLKESDVGAVVDQLANAYEAARYDPSFPRTLCETVGPPVMVYLARRLHAHAVAAGAILNAGRQP